MCKMHFDATNASRKLCVKTDIIFLLYAVTVKPQAIKYFTWIYMA